MRVTDIQVVPFQPAFAGGGYVMSHVVQKTLCTRLIRITSENGHWGVGEIVRRPKDDHVAAAALEDILLESLPSARLADLPDLLGEWRQKGAYGAAFGVELALFDLMGRQMGMPLSALLGGPSKGHVPAYLSLSSADAGVMAAAVRARPGYPVVQAKLGIDDIDQDLCRVQAVLDAMAPDQRLLADFNGALDPVTACRALGAVNDPRLMWEDPCASYDDNATVAGTLQVPIMFDMCMSDLSVFVRALREGVAAALVVKPPFMGGLGVARTARDLCRAAGVPFRVDGPWSGPVAAASAIHLALGAGSGLLCSADLTDPLGTVEIHREFNTAPAA